MDMLKWLEDTKSLKVKKPMPVLSFPGTALAGVTVKEAVSDSDAQAKCVLAIAEKYDTAAAVGPMDLSVEAEALGSKIHYSEDDVPTVLEALIHDEDEAQALEVPEIGVGRTGECIAGIKKASELIMDRPVLAGMIGPYSLAGRLLDMTEIMILCYENPELVETVLEKVTEFLIQYAKAFKEAGANGIAMAEPAAGILSPGLMAEFSNPYVKRIKDAVEDENFIVLYHNCGNIEFLLDQIKDLGAVCYSFGNAADMKQVMDKFQGDELVLGNIDPAGVLRNGTPEIVKEETWKLLEQCSEYDNFVLSSGCDIPPMTPLANIQAFFDAADEYYKTN